MLEEVSEADAVSEDAALARGAWEICAGAESEAPVPPEEHPAAPRANRQVSPAAGLIKPLIAYAPALVISVSGPKQSAIREFQGGTSEGDSRIQEAHG